MKEYTVELGGIERTVLLDDEDAKARGLLADKPATKKAAAPANKARTAKNKQG